MNFQRGDHVQITYGEQTKQATVILASPNGNSVMLSFDGILWNTAGGFAGAMPMLRDAAGIYWDLLDPASPVRLVLVRKAQ